MDSKVVVTGVRAGAGFACEAKKAIIMFIACSVAEDGSTTVCDMGPECPRDFNMENPVLLIPSKSEMLGGWYFVASPAAYKEGVQ
jgi:hypothetical protein